jgi:hypothetical protein
MSNVAFFIDENKKPDNNNILICDESNINEQLASFLSEEEYNNFINNNNNDDTYDNTEIDINQLMLFYNEYNVKYLTQLLQYYGIYKQKMVKNEMIQILALFETQEENTNIVKKRMRLWRNIEELKADSFFNKYIMF